jgi:hypothetical protein
MIRTQIQIHSEQLKWLKDRALGKGVSMSQLIRDSIDFYRAHSEKSSRLKGIKENALNAVGSFSTSTGQTIQD